MFYFRISGPNLQGVPTVSGVPFNQWKILLVAQRVYKSNSHYCSCSWNYHINIVGPHIKLFSYCMCLFFSFNCPTPEFKNNKMKHKNTLNYTTQIGHHWSNVKLWSFWPMSRNRSISYHQKYLKQVAQRATIAHLSPMCQCQTSF